MQSSHKFLSDVLLSIVSVNQLRIFIYPGLKKEIYLLFFESK